jgi:uncharacterized membrane protein YtjA (UPF0391 family)
MNAATGWGEAVPTPRKNPFLTEGLNMLRLAILFLVIALIAALFGFTTVTGVSIEAAKIIFFVFIVLAVLSFFGGMVRRPPV